MSWAEAIVVFWWEQMFQLDLKAIEGSEL